ncbi:hypothetical protein QAD02_005916 [Eretmocerus hayati]|uniref:Uncharacterized protein n=1 Tax=Eretmocerus hayati TaxID=131215 RepID=A0ACC2MZM5_9HYME|nr:hypothetical protein QAD02_005916 [Eretmocerus hayati]
MKPLKFCGLNVAFTIVLLAGAAMGSESTGEKPVKKIKKDVRDMNDADLERLFDQWEENEEPLEEDELPEHLRPQPKIDMSKMDLSNPDNILKMTKKGKSLMMFVDVDPEMSSEKAEEVLRIWQSSLHNNHIIAERYPIDKNRAIFMFKDGAQAVDAKNYIIEQPECAHVTLEGQNYYGKHSKEGAKEKVQSSQSKVKVEKVKKSKKTEL